MHGFSMKVMTLSIFGLMLMLVPIVNPVFTSIPVVKTPSAKYDCDDAALDLYKHFKQIGIPAIPIVGNLDLSGETFIQCNHVWLLVKINNQSVAYDWGQPRFDLQHFEGFEIDSDYLDYAVQTDKENPDILGLSTKSK